MYNDISFISSENNFNEKLTKDKNFSCIVIQKRNFSHLQSHADQYKIYTENTKFTLLE